MVCVSALPSSVSAVVWSCLPFIGSGQNHPARHSERGGGEKTRQTEEEVGRQYQENGQAWSSPSHRGQWRTGKGGNWLRNHLWCPNDPRGLGIDDDDDDVTLCTRVFC